MHDETVTEEEPLSPLVQPGERDDDVTVRVQRSYKGGIKVGDTVVVRREGGTVDGIGMKVFGAAHRR